MNQKSKQCEHNCDLINFDTLNFKCPNCGELYPKSMWLNDKINSTKPESKQEKMPELEWNERGDFNRRVAEGTREFIKNSQPESKQGWRERFEQSFPNLEINMAVTDKLTGEKIKLEGLDVILLKDFISSEIAEARDDVIRKFATGEFVKTPLADKLVAEAKRELLKEIKDPKDGEKDKRIAD